MIVILQCAGSKRKERLYVENGRPVIFVARPDFAPQNTGVTYKTPDDYSLSGKTYREEVLNVNLTDTKKEYFYTASNLYSSGPYAEISEKSKSLGFDFYILSAGWGLIRGDFMLPYYDITFSSIPEKYKVRKLNSMHFKDFNQISKNNTEDIHVFCGAAYLKFLYSLIANLNCNKIIHHGTNTPDKCQGFIYEKSPYSYTNWQYTAVSEFVGRLKK